MRVFTHVVSDSPHPALAWREQTQRRTRQLLDEGRVLLGQADSAAWSAIKAKWRSFVCDHFVGIDEYAGQPIEARLLKETTGDGFRVQNIVFESMPGWQVGLNLFLPPGDGPHVPILCPCGHGPKWQDDHQIPPQILARYGFAAALFDMPMFGEKTRCNDHFIQGSQAGMAGLWSNLFFLIDAVRTADYLQTRPDIDFGRGMGVTGVSGGGFATMFMGVIDSRVEAIAPVCSVAPFGGHVIEGLYTGCPENYMPGQAALGLDFDHLLCLAAPLPCLVINGSQDELFRPDLVDQAVAQARRVYELEGVPERISQFTEDSPHKYTALMAEQTAAWFGRWLSHCPSQARGRGGEVALLAPPDLDCGTSATTDGMVEIIRRRVDDLHARRQPESSDQAIKGVLKIGSGAAARTLVEPVPVSTWGYPWLRKGILRAEGDLDLPFVKAEFPDAPAGTILCFAGDGKHGALRQGDGLAGLCRTIIAADVRGFGELEPEPTDYDLFSWCAVDRALSDLLLISGETALGQQTRDALRAFDALDSTSLEESAGGLIVYGEGEAALPALFAGLLQPRVTQSVLDEFLCAFEALATASAPVWKRYSYLPDVLQHFDLPELFRQRIDKRFLLINPLDADKQRLDEMDALKLYGLDDPHIAVHVDYETRAGSVDSKGVIREWLDRESTPRLPVDPTLALHGGQPVRTRPLSTRFLGADWTGLNELRNVRAAIGTKTLFRHYGLGQPAMAETLERAVREKFGVPHALAVTSGSAALTCALVGLGIGPGDEVILPAFSWFSCYESIVSLGALPVFCEIDRSLDIDPADFERKITPRTRAVIAVHYQGSPAGMDRVMDAARRHSVRVLEDCAQAIGAAFQGRYAGTIGDVGTFSLQGNKLITSGEGGLVVTRDPLVFERAARYHDLGLLRPVFKNQLDSGSVAGDFAASQFRMNEETAAVALAQLDRLDWIVGRCRGLWRGLREQLSREAPGLRLRQCNDLDGDAGITLYLDLGKPERARGFSEALAAEGIPLGPSSGMTNLLRQPIVTGKGMAHPGLPPFGPGHAGEHVVYTPELTPQTDDILNSMIALAISPRFTPPDIDDIAAAVVKVHRSL
jgi:dTDP-4-amino-4,6-dideoxygalactose transaminase